MVIKKGMKRMEKEPKTIYFTKLEYCPNCGNLLNEYNICDSCGSVVYDFCGEHVRNHNGKTYIRFITESNKAELLAQVSSHKICIDTSKFPNTFVCMDMVGSVQMKEIDNGEK